MTSDPARFGKQFTDNSYHYLFEVTRFVDFIQWVSLPPQKYKPGVRATLHKVYKTMAKYLLAMMQVTQVFLHILVIPISDSGFIRSPDLPNAKDLIVSL
ncbi:MAG: DUF4400 domain-containing protein [Candidatus Thiodiazotropha sp.]